ncbi:MAG: radical SAM protein, partial [Eubacteriales bacterium]
MEDIYIYVNVPFCLKRCNYCYCTLAFLDDDLFSWKNNSELYVQSILKEISEFNGQNNKCLGISFGGGTPSLLEIPQIESIFNAAMKRCDSIKEKAQISIEIFPGTKSLNELKYLNSIGFNRASIGAQSFSDDELKKMGRPHDRKAIYKTYDDLCAAGFDNINLDIMFGLPIGNLSSWMNTVDEALRLKPTHLTAYYWFITNGCNFFYQIKNGVMKLTSREECINQYEYVINKSKENGLNFYYDYNFCRASEYEYAIERDMFRHFPVKGFGPNAWSQDGSLKITNSQNLQSYFINPFDRTIRKFPVD